MVKMLVTLLLAVALSVAGSTSAAGHDDSCPASASTSGSCRSTQDQEAAAASTRTAGDVAPAAAPGVLLIQRHLAAEKKDAGVPFALSESSVVSVITDGDQVAKSDCCADYSAWPNVDNGVTCGGCRALVLTAPYGGRCDLYCQSFGHICVAAEEEVNENCAVLYTSQCSVPIEHTSDMLCTCRKPDDQCTSVTKPPSPSPAPAPGPVSPPAQLSWVGSGQYTGWGQWCKAEVPASSWNLRTTCAGPFTTKVKVLTYNLFWWNLFGKRGGAGGSAGKLISSNAGWEGYDLMAFQECDDINRILSDAGMSKSHTGIAAGHAVGLAYLTSRWTLQGKGGADIAEDTRAQWYGTRLAYWLRLRNVQTGKTVFFLNHHGPLPVNSGGVCGGDATAYNLLKMVATNAAVGDLVIIVGDFNADPSSNTIKRLNERMWSIYTGRSFGGVDNILSNCGKEAVVSTRNLGGGGSDHDALDATFQF